MRHFLIPVSLLFLLTAVPCSAQEEDDDYIEVETLTKVVETEYGGSKSRTRRSIQRRVTSFFEFGLLCPPWMS